MTMPGRTFVVSTRPARGTGRRLAPLFDEHENPVAPERVDYTFDIAEPRPLRT
jgi:hypothetical protein